MKKINYMMFIKWAGTILALALLYFMLSKQGKITDIWARMRDIPTANIIYALILVFISRIAIAIRWFVMVRAAGVEMPLIDSLRLTFAGLFANNFLPSTVGGDVLRLGGATYEGYDAAKVTASLVMDRVLGTVTWFCMIPFSWPLLMKLKGGHAAGLMMMPVIGMTEDNGIKAKIIRIIKKLFSSLLMGIKNPLALLGALVFTAVHMFCTFMILRLFLPESIQIDLWTIGKLWTLVYFSSLLPTSINGLGVQEAVAALVFLLGAGITGDVVTSMALLYRFFIMFASLPGAFFITSISRNMRTQKDAGDVPAQTADNNSSSNV
jgi:uncharacterized membrane protein YbhN (UPF0104 family)